MNRGAARVEVKRRGFDYLLDDRANSWLNHAKNVLEDAYDWPWLVTSTTGTAPLTISDLKHVLHVVDTSNRLELIGVKAQDIIAQFDTDLTSTGTPELWWLNGENELNVYPVNVSASLSVRYVKFSPELATDSESPLIPARYHNVWIDLVVVEAYKDNDDHAQAEQLLGEVNRRIGSMIDVYETRNRQNTDYQIIRPESILYGDW